MPDTARVPARTRHRQGGKHIKRACLQPGVHLCRGRRHSSHQLSRLPHLLPQQQLRSWRAAASEDLGIQPLQGSLLSLFCCLYPVYAANLPGLIWLPANLQQTRILTSHSLMHSTDVHAQSCLPGNHEAWFNRTHTAAETSGSVHR